MKNKIAAALYLAVATIFLAGAALAATCIDGGCHKYQVSYKFLHGPLAAEELGAGGCVSCHVPKGAPCTKKDAGIFEYADKKSDLCTYCHNKSTSTTHLDHNDDCLSCHSPHGSNKDGKMLNK
ncbi:hypothetical protein FDZ71_10365 [bacterium]|nr:MAG: hypothetical protein FDZ71_10365 [bacterium]